MSYVYPGQLPPIHVHINLQYAIRTRSAETSVWDEVVTPSQLVNRKYNYWGPKLNLAAIHNSTHCISVSVTFVCWKHCMSCRDTSETVVRGKVRTCYGAQ